MADIARTSDDGAPGKGTTKWKRTGGEGPQAVHFPFASIILYRAPTRNQVRVFARERGVEFCRQKYGNWEICVKLWRAAGRGDQGARKAEKVGGRGGGGQGAGIGIRIGQFDLDVSGAQRRLRQRRTRFGCRLRRGRFGCFRGRVDGGPGAKTGDLVRGPVTNPPLKNPRAAMQGPGRRRRRFGQGRWRFVWRGRERKGGLGACAEPRGPRRNPFNKVAGASVFGTFDHAAHAELFERAGRPACGGREQVGPVRRVRLVGQVGRIRLISRAGADVVPNALELGQIARRPSPQIGRSEGAFLARGGLLRAHPHGECQRRARGICGFLLGNFFLGGDLGSSFLLGILY